MFYVKVRLNENTVLETNITRGGVCCRCPHCGREVDVDLTAFAGDKDFNLYESSVLCAECSEAYLKEAWTE